MTPAEICRTEYGVPATVAGSRSWARISAGISRKYRTAGSYVAACRRLDPSLRRDNGWRHDGRLVAAAWNLIPPREWVTMIDGFAEWYYSANGGLPIGNPNSPYPDSALLVWLSPHREKISKLIPPERYNLLMDRDRRIDPARIFLVVATIRRLGESAPHYRLSKRTMGRLLRFEGATLRAAGHCLIRNGRVDWAHLRKTEQLLTTVPVERLKAARVPAIGWLEWDQRGAYSWCALFLHRLGHILRQDDFSYDFVLFTTEAHAHHPVLTERLVRLHWPRLKGEQEPTQLGWTVFPNYDRAVAMNGLKEGQDWIDVRVAEILTSKPACRAIRWLEQAQTDSREKIPLTWGIALAAVFGANWRGWVTGGNADWTLHDRCYWLPTTVSPEDGLGERLFAWRKENPNLHEKVSELAMVSSEWNSFTPEERKLPLAQLVKVLRAQQYPGAKNAEFAAECAQWGVSKEKYAKYERRFLAGFSELFEERLPKGVRVRVGNLRAEFLPRRDPRALWAGKHTKCCQYPGGGGGSCAWHGALDPNGGIWAVFKGDEIVAQAWVWRRGDDVCFDNIEAIKGSHREDLPKLLSETAKKMIGKMGIRKITVGTGESDCDLSDFAKTNSIASPNGCYSDANNQRLLAESNADDDADEEDAAT